MLNLVGSGHHGMAHLRLWMEGSCKYGNKPSDSIKCGEFLDWLSEGLCSMELII